MGSAIESPKLGSFQHSGSLEHVTEVQSSNDIVTGVLRMAASSCKCNKCLAVVMDEFVVLRAQHSRPNMGSTLTPSSSEVIR
jgi:hypothetical protein